jgi:hypothetical protein
VPGSVEQLVESMELGRTHSVRLEPRCRVCRNDSVREQVNGLLAVGAGYAHIVRTLAVVNAELDERDRVTVDSVRRHTIRHFPVQQTARAIYRDIVERRAEENEIDFFEGVATAVTSLAYLETVMVKGYRTLVDDRTEVSVETGLRAAEKLQILLDERERGSDTTEVAAKLDRIIEAVRAEVPQEYWQRIVRRLNEPEQLSGPSDADTERLDEEDDFDVPYFAENNDELLHRHIQPTVAIEGGRCLETGGHRRSVS